tara:strand:+ start:424 stop:936 length:513 start_codon:yes stop_codon:yes gene_type:complete
MAEREDWLSGPMTRAEVRELSDVDKKERSRLKKNIIGRKYREENLEQVKETQRKHREANPEYNRKYYQENTEKMRENSRKYYQSPTGKKNNTISSWVNDLGLKESPEDLDRIYELRENQELCNACDCVLTRTGKRISTDASMDHDHDTYRFRHIICRGCNNKDSWKKYFC